MAAALQCWAYGLSAWATINEWSLRQLNSTVLLGDCWLALTFLGYLAACLCGSCATCKPLPQSPYPRTHSRSVGRVSKDAGLCANRRPYRQFKFYQAVDWIAHLSCQSNCGERGNRFIKVILRGLAHAYMVPMRASSWYITDGCTPSKQSRNYELSSTLKFR
jgi:hypothetical protein